MTKNSTSLKKGDNLPPRGKSRKTLILDAIRESSLMEATPDTSRDDTEKLFFKHISIQASNPGSENFALCLKLLADKGWASLKPTMDHVEFTFDEDATPAKQASQVMNAAASGRIPPDVAKTFIDTIAAMIKIEEYTELKDRLDAIERAINASSNPK